MLTLTLLLTYIYLLLPSSHKTPKTIKQNSHTKVEHLAFAFLEVD